jgi:site-specific recombinase XerC
VEGSIAHRDGLWLPAVVGQVLDHNPAAAVRGPRLVIRTGKTPVMEDAEARTLLSSIAGDDLADRRDKALLAVMLYSFARVGAIVRLRVRDYENERRRAYLALREKGGQHQRVPVHSRSAAALDASGSKALLPPPPPPSGLCGGPPPQGSRLCKNIVVAYI